LFFSDTTLAHSSSDHSLLHWFPCLLTVLSAASFITFLSSIFLPVSFFVFSYFILNFSVISLFSCSFCTSHFFGFTLSIFCILAILCLTLILTKYGSYTTPHIYYWGSLLTIPAHGLFG
jgi:hypothetical protein